MGTAVHTIVVLMESLQNVLRPAMSIYGDLEYRIVYYGVLSLSNVSYVLSQEHTILSRFPNILIIAHQTHRKTRSTVYQ